jgi:formylmethanofuran dehydrogenase subunit E
MKKTMRLSTKEDFRNFKKLMEISGMEPMDYHEVNITNGRITIKSCKLRCSLCGSADESKLISRNGVLICEDCIDELEVFKDRTAVNYTNDEVCDSTTNHNYTNGEGGASHV